MRRYKPYEPWQGLMLTTADPSLMFPEGTWERFLVTIIDQLDPDDLYPDNEIDQGGEAPYDPRAMLGIFFYAYSRGVYSSRKIECLCRQDLGFMFVGGHAQPDYSTICHFFKTKKHLMEDVFTKVLYAAHRMGFIDQYGLIATDGTKIRANASKDWSGTVEDFRRKRLKLRHRIEVLLGRHDRPESAEEIAEEARKLDKQVRALQQKERKVLEFLQTASAVMGVKGEEIHQNLVDPDCRIMKLAGGGGYATAYNAQSGISAESGLIVAADVTNEANDCNQFLPLVEAVEELAPAELKESLSSAQYVNDCGYHTVDNIIEADARGLDIYIPEKSVRKQRSEKTHPDTHPIQFDDCTVVGAGAEAVVTCPGGRVLSQVRRKQRRNENYLFFSPEDRPGCLACRFAARCLGKKRPRRKEFMVGAKKFAQLHILDKHRKKMATEEAKRIYARRAPTIERQYGHTKRNLGFQFFLRRGLANVRGEWLLLCSAFNLRRIFVLGLAK